MNIATRFTLKYLELVKSALKIQSTKDGAVFFPGSITDDDIELLSSDLEHLFSKSGEVIEYVRQDHSTLQSCAYGLCEDFELLIKSGLLLGERIGNPPEK